jgi:hypothetical protein
MDFNITIKIKILNFNAIIFGRVALARYEVETTVRLKGVHVLLGYLDLSHGF